MNVDTEKVSIMVVNGTKTLLISAFMEHRLKKKQIHVVAVALHSERSSYVCLLCCQSKLHVSEASLELQSNNFEFKYGTADIMCPLPSDCQSATRVAVMSVSEGIKQAGHEHCSDEGERGFLEVKNQQELLSSFPNNFVVCVSTMFDFTNVLQFVQTMEMLQLLGVNRVVIYKSSCSADMQLVLDYYTHKGLVEVIPWTLSKFLNVSRGWLPLHGPGDIHYFGQIPALNDCLYRYMYKSKWIAMHDLDELILPQSVDSWLELLPLLERNYGANHCFMFENNVFPINVALPPPVNGTHWTNVTGVNILRHLRHEPIIAETHYSNFKIIINPRAVTTPTVHGVLNPAGLCTWIDRKIARLYHTRAPKQPKLTPDKLIYDGRLLSYSARFVPAVSTALRESGLLPKDDAR
ncbi:uncharacterized protein LOC114474848 isoform X2 [Gouania willdenowi]|nr:uncharacterized protein LOC114474848 isoform X2 [Gouania willdenowi]XP_028321212.1 uncharacterized protein LOC114474848 isoform X2 [Gouania willdenowi]